VANPTPVALGPAKLVCLNATTPYPCPATAVNYGFINGWGVARTPIPSARWIWRGDTLATSPANQAVLFERTFTLGANPTGTMYIAADDFAEVLVNGAVAGTAGTLTDFSAANKSQTTLTQVNLTPYLKIGKNQIAIRAQNGPFGCTAKACTYATAPAGVVFGGALETPCPPAK
jgi:hypothetical protein